jgi:hypothetical protein
MTDWGFSPRRKPQPLAVLRFQCQRHAGYNQARYNSNLREGENHESVVASDGKALAPRVRMDKQIAWRRTALRMLL